MSNCGSTNQAEKTEPGAVIEFGREMNMSNYGSIN